jgi:hypothetical protein
VHDVLNLSGRKTRGNGLDTSSHQNPVSSKAFFPNPAKSEYCDFVRRLVNGNLGKKDQTSRDFLKLAEHPLPPTGFLEVQGFAVPVECEFFFGEQHDFENNGSGIIHRAKFDFVALHIESVLGSEAIVPDEPAILRKLNPTTIARGGFPFLNQ